MALAKPSINCSVYCFEMISRHVWSGGKGSITTFLIVLGGDSNTEADDAVGNIR
jgi:hypothetical protein